MRIALYQPDIPQNVGAMLRLGACLGVAIDVIEPCGFPFSDKALRRAGMDYMDRAEIAHHDTWQAFVAATPGRLVLLTTRASVVYTGFAFEPTDVLLLGRESAGVPDSVHEAARARLAVPLAGDARSLNVVTAAAMVVGEALRQTQGFPATATGTSPATSEDT